MDEDLENTHLAYLAKQLKDAFRKKKSERDRKPYKPHKRFDDHACWLKTAKLVSRLKANPEDFIEAQFRFSKSTVFANTLHGPTAEKRYVQLVAMTSGIAADKIDEMDLATAVTPGKADLAGRMANAMAVLESAVQTSNFLHPAAKNYIMAAPWMFDALTVMIMAGQDPDYQKQFGAEARQMLIANPYLRTAAEEMSLDLEPIYNDPSAN